MFKKIIPLFALTCFLPSIGYSYWQNLPYKDDITEHKRSFLQWISAQGLWDPYARIILTMSCNDCDDIPKVPNAGKVFENEPVPYQLMHNGIKIVKDCYCASWMTDLIYGLKGHHEPQEEKVFHEVLKYIPADAVMIELGSYWGYYSLWFAKQIANSTNYLIEPDSDRLNLGSKNFQLNNLSATFVRGYVGACGVDAGNFEGASQIFIDPFLEQCSIPHVHVLHSDIQGSEFDMLQSAVKSIKENKIDYFFISTHSEKLHFDCISFLEFYGYVIIAEHSPESSFSVDGLVVGRREGVKGPDKIQISRN